MNKTNFHVYDLEINLSPQFLHTSSQISLYRILQLVPVCRRVENFEITRDAYYTYIRNLDR